MFHSTRSPKVNPVDRDIKKLALAGFQARTLWSNFDGGVTAWPNVSGVFEWPPSGGHRAWS